MNAKHIGIVASVSIVSVIVGCGGGGGNNSTTTTAVPSTVTAESGKIFASHLAKFDGCTEVNVVSLPTYKISSTSAESNLVESRAYDINEVISGTCGGTLTKTGKHDKGTSTLVYDYENFCINNSYPLTLDGVSNVVNLGKPSDFGPVVYEDTISTEGRMSVSFDKAKGIARVLPSSLTASLSNFSIKYGSGDKTIPATESTPDTVNINAADIIYDSNGDKYAVSNVSASTYVVSNILNVLKGTGTYTDPELGTYTVNTENLELPLNSIGLPVGVNGSATITATDGTKGQVKFEDGVIVLSLDDGTQVAQVDCTELANQLVD